MATIFDFLDQAKRAVEAAPPQTLIIIGAAATSILIIQYTLHRVARWAAPSQRRFEPDSTSSSPILERASRRLSKEEKIIIARAALAQTSPSYTLVIARETNAPGGLALAGDLACVLGNLHKWQIVENATPNGSHQPLCGLSLCVRDRNDLSQAELIVLELLRAAAIEFEIVQNGIPDADVGLIVSAG